MYLPAVERKGCIGTFSSTNVASLSRLERVALAVGIIEIPFCVDKYFGYAEEHGELGAVAGFPVSLTTICFTILYVIWLLRWMQRELPTPTFFGMPQIIYLAAVAFSILAAEVRMLAACELFLLLQAYAIFFYVANRITSSTELTFVLGCLALAMALQGLIMIGQKGLGEAAYGQTFELSMIKFDVWEDGRTAGTLRSAVLAGSWLAIVWLVILPLFIVTRDRRLRHFLAICLALGILGILFTQTRGAIVTVAVGTIVLAFAMLRRGLLPNWFNKAGLLAALLAVIPMFHVVQSRIVRSDDGSAQSRKHLTAIAVKTIAQDPIWGYGAGNCHLACLPIANSVEFRSEWYYTIHCKYLLVWIESGIFGLLAFLAILFNGVRHGVAAWLRRHPVLSPIGLGCSAAILGHMIHMLVDIFNSRPQVQTLWLVLGIVAAIWQMSQSLADRRFSDDRRLSGDTF